MRLIYLALVVALVVLVLGLTGATRSDGLTSNHGAANHGAALTLPGSRATAPKVMTVLNGEKPLVFCGQCSDDDDCGVSYKCCGPSDCLQCFRVDTCP
jgi:hypothetical protein